ncbi:MAG: hypothetical protein AB2L14_08960 [Candidatus Xenobiia bacterium LiM19]
MSNQDGSTDNCNGDVRPEPVSLNPARAEVSGNVIVYHGAAIVVACILMFSMVPALEKFLLSNILPTPLSLLEGWQNPLLDKTAHHLKSMFRIILSQWSFVIFLAVMAACLKKDRIMAITVCIFLFISALSYLLFCSGAVSAFSSPLSENMTESLPSHRLLPAIPQK